jgi:hypothetical protein
MNGTGWGAGKRLVKVRDRQDERGLRSSRTMFRKGEGLLRIWLGDGQGGTHMRLPGHGTGLDRYSMRFPRTWDWISQVPYEVDKDVRQEGHLCDCFFFRTRDRVRQG